MTRDALKADIIDMYDNAIRAADTKAQIILVFATLFLNPAFSTAERLEFERWMYVVIVLEFVAAAVFFVAAVLPRTSLPGTSGLFSHRFSGADNEFADPSKVQDDMLDQKHEIYFAKLRYVRLGMIMSFVQVVTFGAFVAAVYVNDTRPVSDPLDDTSAEK